MSTSEDLICYENMLSMDAYDTNLSTFYNNDKPYDPRSPAYNPHLGKGYLPPYDPVFLDFIHDLKLEKKS